MPGRRERLGTIILPAAVRALPRAIICQPALLEAPKWPHTTDASSWSREFARFASMRYGLPLPLLSVEFHPLDAGRAGEVEDRGDSCVIVIDPRFQWDIEVLGHVLAHEVAHLLLHRMGVSLEAESDDERLTDAVAVLAGFGPLMLAGKGRSKETGVAGGVQTHTTAIGYLTAKEIRWLMRVREHIADSRPWLRRSVNRRRRHTIECPVCATQSRLPNLEATIDLTCPACLVRQRIRLRDGSFLATFVRWVPHLWEGEASERERPHGEHVARGAPRSRHTRMAFAAVGLVIVLAFFVGWALAYVNHGLLTARADQQIQPSSPSVLPSIENAEAPAATPAVGVPCPAGSTTRPKSGAELGGNLRGGLGRIRVINGREDDAIAVLVQARSARPQRAIYIRAGESGLITRIRPGTFRLQFKLGQSWNTDRRDFCGVISTSEFDDPFEFEERDIGDGIQYSTFEVTLQPMRGGTATTHNIPPEAFELPPVR